MSAQIRAKSTKENVNSKRDGKLFPIFQVMTFKNDACTGKENWLSQWLDSYDMNFVYRSIEQWNMLHRKRMLYKRRYKFGVLRLWFRGNYMWQSLNPHSLPRELRDIALYE